MEVNLKIICWNERAREFVRALDISTKREIGALLMLLQMGKTLSEPQVKPMKNIYKNAFELRVKDKKGSYRIIYILNFQNMILIPHAFNKKTAKTPKKEIDVAIRRLQEMIYENQ